MECGPLQETMRGPLGSLFEETQYVMDVYGAGNNFANGHYIYGPQYRWKRNADFSRFSVAFFSPFQFPHFFPIFSGVNSKKVYARALNTAIRFKRFSYYILWEVGLALV